MWHKQHKCNTSATRATQVRHEWDKSNTSVTRVRNECYTNEASVARVKNFDFDNDTSENIFSHHYINYVANERLQGQEQFYSKNYLLEMTLSHIKMRLKSALQNLNFVMANIKKVILKHYALDCRYSYG